MPVDVAVQVDGFDASRLAGDAQAALVALRLEAAELSLVLCDDEAIRELNRRWRGKDEPTDVLSFPQDPTGPVLGDIVISLATAQRQASQMGHSLHRELRVLLVHGLCHLRGHDHHEPEEKEAMIAVERALMIALAEPGASLIERVETTR